MIGRNLIEICRFWRAWFKRRPDLGFIDEEAVGGLVCRHANTVTCELKLALMKRHLASKMV